MDLEMNKIKTIMTSISNELITQEEYSQLFDTVKELLDDYIKENILDFSKPNFHEELFSSIYELLEVQFEYLNMSDSHYIFYIIYEKVSKIYFKFVIPPRSYDKTFIRKSPNISFINQKITYLENKPQPAQRTKEWYEFRHSLITASSAWKALDTQSSINSIIYEKCSPYDGTKFDSVNMDSPFHWGTKYEPISVQVYEKQYKTVIKDFGCLRHDEYSFLGASPDGINVDEMSCLYGRMLEIKNIVNREINGIPKMEYWIQMQLQMEVCDLNECDFLETKFTEYDGYNEFIKDGSFIKTEDGKDKGIFILFMDQENKPYYEYPELKLQEDEFMSWREQIISKNGDKMWVKDIYWKLDVISCILVLRNKPWSKEAAKKIGDVWSIIENERTSGYEHRAPKKRQKKNEMEKEKRKKGCLICFEDNKISVDDENNFNKIIKVHTEPLVKIDTEPLVKIDTEPLIKMDTDLI